MVCKTVLLGCLVFYAASVFAATTNLGVVGTTYPVVEPDMVAELKERASIESRKRATEFKQRMKTYQPENLYTLQRASNDRSFVVDMTYTLDRDLKDGDGRVLYPKGFTFNPLDYVSLSGGLLIIDGGDPSQLKWAENTPYIHDHRVRLLLSGGYAYQVIERLDRPVFYLTEEIAKRLQLTAVPALVIQQGKNLQVLEFLIPQEEDHANR